MDQKAKYVKTNWIDKKTIITANNMNKLENQVDILTDSLELANASLEQKANKNEIGTPLVSSSVSEMTDRTKVYVNATDGNWYSWNGTAWVIGGTYNSQGIGDKTITPSKTSFIKIGKNIFDKNNILLKNKFITSIGGISSSTTVFDTSEWIELRIGEKYTISNEGENNTFNFVYICFYSNKDLNNSFVTRIDTSTTSTPKKYSFISEYPYCVICYRNDKDTKIQFEKGDIRTDYEVFHYELNENVWSYGINISDTIPKLEKNVGELSEKVIDYSIFDQAYIKNGELICNSDHINSTGVVAKYTCANLGENAITVKCKCKFIGHSTVALISEPNGMRKVEDVTMKSVHITYNSLGFVNVGYFNNKTLTNVQKINYTPLEVTGNTVYELGYTVENDGITIILPNGTTQKVLSPEFQNNNGKYIIWEHYSTGVTETNFGRPVFLEFYAVGSSDNPITDKFLRQNGAIGISPSGHVYAQFRNV